VHELSIVQSVVDAIGERMGDARVGRVTLEIGRLSGVVADSVRFCFDLVAEGTTLDGARLEIVEPAGRATCRTCGAEIELADFFALCSCGSADLDVTAGEELRIREVELV
jgi:hydrogenase nickel incorporation protein HypA/HybF